MEMEMEEMETKDLKRCEKCHGRFQESEICLCTKLSQDTSTPARLESKDEGSEQSLPDSRAEKNASRSPPPPGVLSDDEKVRLDESDRCPVCLTSLHTYCSHEVLDLMGLTERLVLEKVEKIIDDTNIGYSVIEKEKLKRKLRGGKE